MDTISKDDLEVLRHKISLAHSFGESVIVTNVHVVEALLTKLKCPNCGSSLLNPDPTCSVCNSTL